MSRRFQLVVAFGWSLATVMGLFVGQAAAINWIGGSPSGDDWNIGANWEGGFPPDQDFGERADIGPGDNPQIIADLEFHPRSIKINGGTVDHSAGLVDIDNRGFDLGEDMFEPLPPGAQGPSVYNLSGGEVRVHANSFTDVNIGLREGTDPSSLNISGTGFLNQESVLDAARGVKVGRFEDGELTMRDSARLFTAGKIFNGGEPTAQALAAGVGTIRITGGNVQIDAGDDFRQDAVSILDLHIDGTGISPINTLGAADLDGFLQVEFLVTPSVGASLPIINTATGVTGLGTFAGGVSVTGLGAGQSLAVDYAGGDGNDVVLNVMGAGTPGDFDGDGDRDGADFLLWQRGGSPNPLSQGDLADWETNFGAVLGLNSLAAASTVPEPSGTLLAIMAAMVSVTTGRCLVRGKV